MVFTHKGSLSFLNSWVLLCLCDYVNDKQFSSIDYIIQGDKINIMLLFYIVRKILSHAIIFS